MNIFIIKHLGNSLFSHRIRATDEITKYIECFKTLIHITNIHPEFVLLLVSCDPLLSPTLKLSLQSQGIGTDLSKVIKWQIQY